jgi:hypothetical protein
MRCEAITQAGSRCRLAATPGATWCYSHDPARVEERRRNARKAGRSGGNGRPGGLSETARAKRDIRGLVAKVITGDLDRSVATAAFMGLNVLARYIELERKIVEQEELRERIEHLENLERKPGGGRRWGA